MEARPRLVTMFNASMVRVARLRLRGPAGRWCGFPAPGPWGRFQGADDRGHVADGWSDSTSGPPHCRRQRRRPPPVSSGRLREFSLDRSRRRLASAGTSGLQRSLSIDTAPCGVTL